MTTYTHVKQFTGFDGIAFTEAGIKLLSEKLTSLKPPSANLYFVFNRRGNANDYCFYMSRNGTLKQSASVTNSDLTQFTSACYEQEEEDTLNHTLTDKENISNEASTSVQNHYTHITKIMPEHDQYKLVEMLASNLGYSLTDATKEEVIDVDSPNELNPFEIGLIRQYLFSEKNYPKGNPELTKTDVLEQAAEEMDIPITDVPIRSSVFDKLVGKTIKVNLPMPECLKVDDEEIYHIGVGKELPLPTQEQIDSTNTIFGSDTALSYSYSEPSEISTGGACEYYRVNVTHPISSDQIPYTAECGDIMESLEMTYAEANIFKEIWRSAAERTLGVKKAGNNGKRAAEKVVFFANRYYQQQVNQANITGSRRVNKK
jgi:hypothetical protein